MDNSTLLPGLGKGRLQGDALAAGYPRAEATSPLPLGLTLPIRRHFEGSVVEESSIAPDTQPAHNTQQV